MSQDVCYEDGEDLTMRIEVDIWDGINPITALECVKQVIQEGKVSEGENGKMYYCWATTFNTPFGELVVYTRQYRKNDCFRVYRKSK